MFCVVSKYVKNSKTLKLPQLQFNDMSKSLQLAAPINAVVTVLYSAEVAGEGETSGHSEIRN